MCCIFCTILQLCAWLPDPWMKKRLNLTLVWQPHFHSKARQLSTQLYNHLLWCYSMKQYLWNIIYTIDMHIYTYYQMKIWSSHLLDNLSNCLMNLKNSGDSTGLEPMTSAMPVQCSNQLSYEVTQLRAGQFVGLMFSRERNVVWKMYYMKCGVWNQMKIWSSHLLDNLIASQRSWVPIPLSHLNFSGSWDNCLNCPVSARIISSFDFKHLTSYNTSFIIHILVIYIM